MGVAVPAAKALSHALARVTGAPIGALEPCLNFTGEAAVIIGAFAKLLAYVVQPSDFEDSSNGIRAAVMRLGNALLLRRRDVCGNLDELKGREPANDCPDELADWMIRVPLACGLVAVGVRDCPAIAAKLACLTSLKSAFELLEVAIKTSAPFDLAGMANNAHGVYLLVMYLLEASKLHTGHVEPQSLLIDAIGWVELGMRADLDRHFGSPYWAAQMQGWCQLLGSLTKHMAPPTAGGSTEGACKKAVGVVVFSLARLLTDLPNQASSGEKMLESFRCFTGDLVSLPEQLMRRAGLGAHALAELPQVRRAYEMRADARKLFTRQARAALERMLQPSLTKDQAEAEAAAQAAAEALLQEEEAAKGTQSSSKKAKKKKGKKAKQPAEGAYDGDLVPALILGCLHLAADSACCNPRLDIRVMSIVLWWLAEFVKDFCGDPEGKWQAMHALICSQDDTAAVICKMLGSSGDSIAEAAPAADLLHALLAHMRGKTIWDRIADGSAKSS
ncbi:hypothetical protein WJX72_003234 [[Myrmecia] bisecta]|uniref:Neurochondrin-like protein n=1 Tax=[Myrmecia] bisecta TaxID=41462 RepID=A0AAW1R696_9CHLO